MVFVQADQSSGHDHHDHHDHTGDKKEGTQQIGGRLTLPNLKDCTNSKVFFHTCFCVCVFLEGGHS